MRLQSSFASGIEICSRQINRFNCFHLMSIINWNSLWVELNILFEHRLLILYKVFNKIHLFENKFITSPLIIYLFACMIVFSCLLVYLPSYNPHYHTLPANCYPEPLFSFCVHTHCVMFSSVSTYTAFINVLASKSCHCLRFWVCFVAALFSLFHTLK